MAFPAFDETISNTITTSITGNNPFSAAFSNDDDEFFANAKFMAESRTITSRQQEDNDAMFPDTTTSPNTLAFEDFGRGGGTSLFDFASTDKPIAASTSPPSWDISPHDPTQIQILVQQQTQTNEYNLQAKCFFRQKKSTLVATPILNPINSNILFVVREPVTGDVRIHEIDPHRHNLPVASHALLYGTNDALSIAMATKYNVTPVAIPQLWKVTAGRIDQSHSLRLVCLADIAILESAAPMRVVLIYAWNHHHNRGGGASSPALEQVLSPPAGGDFVYSPTSLEISHSGVCFLAGFSTAKGPCVLMHKTTTTTTMNGNTIKNQDNSPRESWSANFVAEGASNNNTAPIIVGMSVAPYDSLPVVAIALADGSITVWSYATALSSSEASVASKQQRWLLPWCSLDVTTIPNAERIAPSVGTSDTVLGKGKVVMF
jgi:hypothetical protein